MSKSFKLELPSFGMGFGNTFSIYGNASRLDVSNEDPWSADNKALASDWKMVGNDLREAICKAEELSDHNLEKQKQETSSKKLITGRDTHKSPWGLYGKIS